MKDSCSRGILFGQKFLISTRYPVNTTPRLPRGRDCVGGVLARAAGARLRELPSAAAHREAERGFPSAAGRDPWDAKHPTQARRTEKFPSSKFPPYHTTPRPKPQAFPHKKCIEKTNKPAAHFGILSANRTKLKNFQKRIAKFHSTW